MAEWDEEQFLEELRRQAQRVGGVSRWARLLKMEASNLHKIVTGKLRPGARTLARLGYHQVVKYATGTILNYHPSAKTQDIVLRPFPTDIHQTPFQPPINHPKPAKQAEDITPIFKRDKSKRWY